MTVDKLVMAVDSGIIVNPVTASGQIEGGMTQALGYAVCEEMVYDEKGNARERDLRDYHIFQAHEMPELETILLEQPDPTGPFGAKGVGEPGCVCQAAAIANAIYDAVGVRIWSLPMTPEKVLGALSGRGQSGRQ